MEGEQGTLVIRVYTSSAQIPVEGASVVVTQRGQRQKYQLVSVQATDRNGRVESIPVHTPPRWESTQPAPPEQPYAVCQVWAEHPGFAILLVNGVQVFSGVETVQDMQLLPLGEGEHSLEARETWNIPPQTL